MNNIPEPVYEVFDRIRKEVLWMHVTWTIYRQLFAHSEQRIELLNKCGGLAFRIFEETLWDGIQLSLTKLTDPATSFGKDNLTFEQLQARLEKSEDTTPCAKLRNLLDGLKDKCAAVRRHRNKRLAHFDLKTAMQDGANLDPISRRMIEEVLSLVREYMNIIDSHYDQNDTKYEQVLGISTADGNALVAWLKDGLEFTEMAKKLGKGRNELRSGKWDKA
jgi:hypothetical protein